MKKLLFLRKEVRLNSFLTVLILLIFNLLNAQTNLVFHTDETGSNVVHKASKNIKFLAGYKFTPSVTKRNHSFIDVTDFAFQNTYTGMSDEMFDERAINTALPVGAIQGNHSVSATGAGTYTIGDFYKLIH